MLEKHTEKENGVVYNDQGRKTRTGIFANFIIAFACKLTIIVSEQLLIAWREYIVYLYCLDGYCVCVGAQISCGT